MVWAFDIETARPGFSGAYHLAAREQGLLLRPIGNTLYLMPPYVLIDVERRHLASGALAALNATVGA
jgi:adenosylmethionine-8-amino-7-oxononanoate aminotransferase